MVKEKFEDEFNERKRVVEGFEFVSNISFLNLK